MSYRPAAADVAWFCCLAVSRAARRYRCHVERMHGRAADSKPLQARTCFELSQHMIVSAHFFCLLHASACAHVAATWSRPRPPSSDDNMIGFPARRAFDFRHILAVTI